MSAIAPQPARPCATEPDPAHEPLRRAAESIGLDVGALRGLLECAGPSLAPELRRRFLSDLSAARSGLVLAATCAAAERHAHVLLALAGQAGATLLQAAAQRALVAARAGDGAALAELAPDVLAGIETLLAVVTGMPGVNGATASGADG